MPVHLSRAPMFIGRVATPTHLERAMVYPPILSSQPFTLSPSCSLWGNTITNNRACVYMRPPRLISVSTGSFTTGSRHWHPRVYPPSCLSLLPSLQVLELRILKPSFMVNPECIFKHNFSTRQPTNLSAERRATSSLFRSIHGRRNDRYPFTFSNELSYGRQGRTLHRLC